MNRNSGTLIRASIIILLVIANIGCDQATKKMIRNSMAQNETITMLNDYLTVTRVENSGAFLSVGDALPENSKSLLLSAIPMTALAIGLFYILYKPTIAGKTLIGLCFIIGGGIGNIFDRIRYGSVTDFLHIDLGFVQTGIFNMADVSILFGMFLVILQSVIAYVRERKANV